MEINKIAYSKNNERFMAALNSYLSPIGEYQINFYSSVFAVDDLEDLDRGSIEVLVHEGEDPVICICDFDGNRYAFVYRVEAVLFLCHIDDDFDFKPAESNLVKYKEMSAKVASLVKLLHSFEYDFNQEIREEGVVKKIQNEFDSVKMKSLEQFTVSVKDCQMPFFDRAGVLYQEDCYYSAPVKDYQGALDVAKKVHTRILQEKEKLNGYKEKKKNESEDQ